MSVATGRPVGTASTEANKKVVSDFLAAINERRVEDLSRHMAHDVVDHNKVIHGEADEPGAAFEGFRQQMVAFGDARMAAQELIAEGDRVVARVVATGTHTGTHPRMPEPTRRSFEVEQIWVFTVTGARISEIRAVSDRLGMFLQLGWDWPTAD
ncbi:ester cyclase [Streptomyces sp. ICBB 8177]|uniref:ester cyclase n=1 Tax=Streptomyces sp. ICBB 8177 TaxID=563922 RepID=UPI000D6811E7|nr:ester cyclase [Streptomyces sp. ICBB 8177]PWI42744.1 ester cyclase [Streptomyces sp. ICBB 8177]